MIYSTQTQTATAQDLPGAARMSDSTCTTIAVLELSELMDAIGRHYRTLYRIVSDSD